MIKVPEWFVAKYPQGDQAFVNIEKLVNAKTNEPYKYTWVFNSEAELTNEEQEELQNPSPAPSPAPQPRNAYEMGMAKGNAINAITQVLVAFIRTEGYTLPQRDWIEEAAHLINFGADAILNGRETEEHEEEEEDDTSTTPSS
jgi:hypothetical protein